MRFGRYVLEAELGRGGMGEVWKAFDPELSRSVALKLLAGDPSEDGRKRFQREAKALAALTHPNIAAVYDAGEQDGRRYIAMQLIDGETLHGKRLEPRRAAEVVRDAARAVEFAHQHGVIHRDLKPENLMTDGAKRVFVLDFGLARATRVDASVSASGVVMGTPSYMSPEQAMGETRLHDARTDVYSLGATLYALLHGRPPYDGATMLDVLVQVSSDEPPQLEGVPGELRAILLRAMAKDRAARYASAAELADDLDRWLAGEPVRARPPSALAQSRRWVKRHRGVVFTTLLWIAVALGIVGFYILRAQMERTRESDIREAAERDRRERLREIRALIREARLQFYVRGSDVKGARDKVARSTKAFAEATDTVAVLGMAKELGGDASGALPLLERAHAQDPHDAEVASSLARVRWELALDDRARLAETPGLPEVEGAVARVYAMYAAGDVAGMERAHAEVAAYGDVPGAEYAWVLRGQVRRSVDDCAVAVRINPWMARAYLARGLARGGGDEARADLEKALEVAPPGWAHRSVVEERLRVLRGK